MECIHANHAFVISAMEEVYVEGKMWRGYSSANFGEEK